jgi:hypothetical protein
MVATVALPVTQSAEGTARVAENVSVRSSARRLSS